MHYKINIVKYYFDIIYFITYFVKKTKTMRLPCKCPSCERQLKVKAMKCEHCETEVTGLYDLPVINHLSADEQDFILHFVKTSGSLKEMAKHLGLSYPTVRNILDEIIKKLKSYETEPST